MFAPERKLVGLWVCLALAQAQQLENNAERDKTKITLDLAGSATAKSYESPEYYRGSEPIGAGTVYISKPTGGANPSLALGSVGEGLDAAYSKWRQAGGADLQERISVGHYGAGAASHGHSQSGASYSNYESHPHPYAYEYSHGTHGSGAGTAGGSGAYYGSSSAEAVPFDVYGSKTGPSQSHGHGHYAGAGGDYTYSAYPYHVDSHEIASHKGPTEVSHKALLAKSFLIPLASAAVLGIAAALVSNPLLLQLGTVSGLGVGGLSTGLIGKRKRRALQRAYHSKIKDHINATLRVA